MALRRDAAARTIARAWRTLTGGGRGRDASRRTLVACSGGADSAALVLALAAHAQDQSAVVVGHVVHDMRPRKQVLAERDRVRVLAESLGLGFVEVPVRVRGVKGNAERAARDRRYAALAQLASEAGCGWIATGHQGDDLLETVLMRLVRGTGVRGLVGVHESRPLEGSAVTLIRPMLGTTRADAERICELAGWTPNVDPTNADTTRLRARLRHDVLPVLRDVAPGVHERVLETSRVMAGISQWLDRALLGEGVVLSPNSEFVEVTLPRERAREMPAAVLAELLRDAVRRCGALDKLPARAVIDACGVIQGTGTDRKVLRLPGVEVRVSAREIVLRRR